MEPWTRQLLSIIVSQICKTIGWHSISTTSLSILVDVLHRYLKQLGTNIHGYSEHFNHNLPALEEINLAFTEMGINVEDLREYVDYVSSIPLKTKVPKYPLEKKSNLNFLKPGSREVVTRPVHIHEHLPAMYPELSEESYPSTETVPSDDLPNLSSSGSPSSYKKLEPDVINNKRLTQLISEEFGRPLRELSCVMMTTSGFLSPAREGKAPEARIPKLNNYSNAHPTQPSSYPTVPPEVKGDHKKLRDSAKTVNNVKSVERKVREEVHQNGKEDFDDTKIKKLASMKELSKLKAFKPMHKIDGVDSPKMIRPEKLKLPASPSPKEKPVKPKVEKPLEKIPEPEVIVEEKLTTEPNKQKLNIFKRISKVKEERPESPVPKLTAEKNAQINETIEAVVKRSREKDEEKINHREEKPKEKSPEPEPAPIKHLKRKKKQKHDVPMKKFKEINHEPEEIEKPKPKMIEIESDVPLYSMMSNIHKTPGIIPASLTQNPLFPRFPHPFINLNRFDSNGPHPEMPNLPLPPLALMSANLDNIPKPPIRTPDEPKPDDEAAIADKKLKKKMKKDKREKDKKKTKKDKLKNKEDKKKDKVLKKIKVKNKNKMRKEKKFTLEKDIIPTEDPSVPKLKLKLGNANSPQLSPSGIQSPKIVIKPIVKHDEPPKSPEPREREPSPELAKISALISKPMKQKQPKIDTPSTSFSKPIEPITIKNKKSLSNEMKPKNKDKLKVKKNEDHKTKPAPFYYDADGNQVWVCPACGAQDDGSPMIGCDGCDAWYHWVCVGIKSPPESAKWFCTTCAKA